MPILKSLTFTAVPARSSDPVAGRRAKLIGRLEEQALSLGLSPVQRFTFLSTSTVCLSIRITA